MQISFLQASFRLPGVARTRFQQPTHRNSRGEGKYRRREVDRLKRCSNSMTPETARGRPGDNTTQTTLTPKSIGPSPSTPHSSRPVTSTLLHHQAGTRPFPSSAEDRSRHQTVWAQKGRRGNRVQKASDPNRTVLFLGPNGSMSTEGSE